MDPLQGLLSGIQQPPQPPQGGLAGALSGSTAQGIGGMFQGLGAGIQGQPDPRIAAQEAQTRQKIQMFQLQQSVDKQRMEKSRMQAELLGALAKSDSPEARTYGVKGIFDLAKKSGVEFPGEMPEGLIHEKIKPGEAEEVTKMLARGVSPQAITQTYPWATPEIQKGLTGKGADFLAMSYGWKTPDQMRRDAAVADKESFKLLRDETYPEVAGNSELQQMIHGAHKDLAKGLTYYEGTDETRAQARAEGMTRLLKARAEKAGAAAGEGIVVEPTGGVFYDTRSHQVRSAVRKGELEASGGTIRSINAQEWQRKDYAERAGNSVASLKALIPKLLATQPAENLVKALELKVSGVVASNPDLRQFHDLVFKTDVELARVLGGGNVIRQRMLELVSKYAGIATTDTVSTAQRLLDNNLIDMENARRGVLQDPSMPLLPLTGAVRIGPGTYWARDTRSGQTVPIKLAPGQISPSHYEVIRER